MNRVDKDGNIIVSTPPAGNKADPIDNTSKKKFVFIAKTLLSESSSSIVWCHSIIPRERFVATAEIVLIDSHDFNFLSPELGKLCEMFLKL